MKRKGKKKLKKQKDAVGASSGEAVPMSMETGKITPAVWRHGQDPIQEGETLDYDPTAYDCLHALNLEYPCLSFDLCKDQYGGPRSAFPHCLQFVASTQADNPRANFIAFAKVSNLQQAGHGKKANEEDDDDMADSDEEQEEFSLPILHLHTFSMSHGTNRVRCMPQRPGIVAVWEDCGTVKVFDGSAPMEELAKKEKGVALKDKTQKPEPLHAQAHRDEGFALDWSCVSASRLASGDNKGNFYVWHPSSSGTSWSVKQYKGGHTSSVEDIQWSPTEDNVIASCSSDKTIRIWDNRTARNMLTVVAHDSDVNVLSWNTETSFMLASGGDEGALKVWDLRSFPQSSPVAHFAHHKAAVTSVEWCPQEASMLTTTGADGQLCVWDLALERDPEEEMNLGEESNAETPEDLPPQLLFVHGGQSELKEAHWHPQIPGMIMSTAADGFNIFKPRNVG